MKHDNLEMTYQCSQCGQCCLAKTCALSIAVFNQPDLLCPCLEQQSGKYQCGLVCNTEQYARFIGIKFPSEEMAELGAYFGKLLGIGRGCDSAIIADHINDKLKGGTV